MIHLYNKDCMEAMASMKTDEFDLAIVDPPYGIHKKLLTTDKNLNQSNKFALLYMKKNWDKKRPSKDYFDELQRVSKNQIIWGGNYFSDLLPPSRGWICWDKCQDNFTCVNNELAWTSFDKSLMMYRRNHGLDNGFMIREQVNERIHPTQKPVALYTWLLNKYAKKDWKILDTHLGSGSSAIAAHDMGFEFHGYELDKEYFEAASKRLKEHQRQLQLF
jgi:site-specific DNA-methyltransferase (adenine-specific)